MGRVRHSEEFVKKRERCKENAPGVEEIRMQVNGLVVFILCYRRADARKCQRILAGGLPHVQTAKTRKGIY